MPTTFANSTHSDAQPPTHPLHDCAAPGHTLVQLQGACRTRFDATAMLVYLLLVFGGSLTLWPLGGDYALLSEQGAAGQPALIRAVLRMELSLFANHPLGYHVVNLLLLYGCMAFVYSLMRRLQPQGPVWLATLCATLFMANPAYSEAVLNVTGVTDLLPAFLGLGALATYTRGRMNPSVPAAVLSWILCALAVVPLAVNAGLVLFLVLYECLVHRKRSIRALASLVPYGLLIPLGFGVRGEAFSEIAVHPSITLAPLYFVLYPIGFLPESVQRFHEAPWLGWLAGATLLAVIACIYRGVKRPEFLVAILGAIALRFYPNQHPIDPVHLVGGGPLLVPGAMITMGVVVVFGRILQHPKWRRSVAGFTTALALLLFGLTLHKVSAWREAASETQTFQQRAVALAESNGGRAIGVLPNFRFYRGAPMNFSDAIAYDSPFSRSLNHVSLLPMHRDYDRKMNFTVEHQDVEGIRVRMTFPDSRQPMTVDYSPFRTGALMDVGLAELECLEIGERHILLLIKPKTGEGILPGDLIH